METETSYSREVGREPDEQCVILEVKGYCGDEGITNSVRVADKSSNMNIEN